MHERQISDHGTLFCPLCRLDTDGDYTPALQWVTTETSQRNHPYFVDGSRIVCNLHPLEAGHPIWPTEPEVLHEFLWCARCNSEYQPGQFGIVL